MGISYLDALLFGKHEIRDEGSVLPQQGAIDFRGAGVTVTDDPATGATRVTIDSLGGGGYNRIQDEGANFPQRSILDFHGFELFDDPTPGKTIVQIGTPSAVNDVLGWNGTKWTARNHLAIGASPAPSGQVRLENGAFLAWNSVTPGTAIFAVFVDSLNRGRFGATGANGTTDNVYQVKPGGGHQFFIDATLFASMDGVSTNLTNTNVITTGAYYANDSVNTIRGMIGFGGDLFIGDQGASGPVSIIYNTQAGGSHDWRIDGGTQALLNATALTLSQNLAMAAGKAVIMDGKRALLEGGSLAVGSADFALVNHIATGYQFFSVGDDIGDTYASIHPTDGFALEGPITQHPATAATAGDYRVKHGWSMQGRDVAGAANVNLLSWGVSAGNEVRVGDGVLFWQQSPGGARNVGLFGQFAGGGDADRVLLMANGVAPNGSPTNAFYHWADSGVPAWRTPSNILILNCTTATSATAGGNGDVPSQVALYLIVTHNGTSYRMAMYNA